MTARHNRDVGLCRLFPLSNPNPYPMKLNTVKRRAALGLLLASGSLALSSAVWAQSPGAAYPEHVH